MHKLLQKFRKSAVILLCVILKLVSLETAEATKTNRSDLFATYGYRKNWNRRINTADILFAGIGLIDEQGPGQESQASAD